ncbi:MAG: hypothetical protein ACRDQU_14150 [Pseudonocardiaceae bacterium]
MTKRLDDCNSSVDTQLARAGACAQIHLPSGRICVLPHHHRGSCRFLSASDVADAEGFVPCQRIAGDHEPRRPARAAHRAPMATAHQVDPGGTP